MDAAVRSLGIRISDIGYATSVQVVVLYVLLGSVSIAAILVGLLSYRSFFTPRHQFRIAPLDR